MKAHIFVDNSNIFGGAQRAATTKEPHVPRWMIRVYYRNFFELIEQDYEVIERVMAGSVPPGHEELWDYSRNAGYNTDLLRRVSSDDGRLVEQAVDEMLHLKIANALLDHEGHVLVLGTGDGRGGHFGTSFPDQVARALKRVWGADIWSWKEQTSGAFHTLAGGNPTRVGVYDLDDYYESITFTKGGAFQTGATQVTLQPRIVRPLPP